MKDSLYDQVKNGIIDGNMFASQNDVNPMEALKSARKTRDAIEKGKPMTMDSEGTLLSRDDENSLTRHNVSEVKDGNKFAAQWYENEKELYEFEFQEMKKAFPKAELSVLKDDRLCWNITFNGILDANGKKHSWNFLLIYDSDHPHNRDYGDRLKYIP